MQPIECKEYLAEVSGWRLWAHLQLKLSPGKPSSTLFTLGTIDQLAVHSNGIYNAWQGTTRYQVKNTYIKKLRCHNFQMFFHKHTNFELTPRYQIRRGRRTLEIKNKLLNESTNHYDVTDCQANDKTNFYYIILNLYFQAPSHQHMVSRKDIAYSPSTLTI